MIPARVGAVLFSKGCMVIVGNTTFIACDDPLLRLPNPKLCRVLMRAVTVTEEVGYTLSFSCLDYLNSEVNSGGCL